MIDFKQIADTLDELRLFVTKEPSLHMFRADVTRVCEDARRLASGDRSVVPLVRPPIHRFPSRQLAEKALEILADFPAIEADESVDDLLLLAQLRGNLVTAFTHALIQTYPDLVSEPP